MENKMKNKIIKTMLILTSLNIAIGLTSCKKECMNEFKKEMENEFKKEGSNCDSTSTDSPGNRGVNN